MNIKKYSTGLNLLFYSLFIGFLIVVSCTKYRTVAPIPKGANKGKIKITSLPEDCRLYINDEYLGTTPIRTTLWYFKKRNVNIKAEPLYDKELPQNIVLKIPPVPDKMTIYLDQQARSNTYSPAEPVSKDPKPKVVEKIKIVEKAINLPVIYFQPDEFVLTDSAKIKLTKLTDLLKNYREIKLAINGFANDIEDKDYLRELSLNRANKVRQFLVKNGIKGERLSVFGFGGTKIVNSEFVQLEFSENRQVNFTIQEE